MGQCDQEVINRRPRPIDRAGRDYARALSRPRCRIRARTWL
jgi:hypothetical protein